MSSKSNPKLRLVCFLASKMEKRYYCCYYEKATYTENPQNGLVALEMQDHIKGTDCLKHFCIYWVDTEPKPTSNLPLQKHA